MCGLFGYRLRDNLVQAPPMFPVFCSVVAVEMERRGTDGWGFAALRPFAHDIEILKCETRLTDSLDSHIFGAYHAMMLHTRAKTIGAHVIANNHPFTHDHIIGAHNGVVYNHDSLQRQHNRSFDVDSQHIFAHIAEGKDLSEVSCYGAIEYMDQRNPLRTYLCRMYHGQLTVAQLFYGKGLGGGGRFGKKPFAVVWASTESSLLSAARLAGFHIETYASLENRRLYYVDGNAMLCTTDTTLAFSDRIFTAYTGPMACASPMKPYSTQYSSGSKGKGTDTPRGTASIRGRHLPWKVFGSIKVRQKSLQILNGLDGCQVCQSCGVYYSLVELTGCLFCGRDLAELSAKWCRERYLPGEIMAVRVLETGCYTPPMTKRHAKKYASLLEELCFASPNYALDSPRPKRRLSSVAGTKSGRSLPLSD